MSVESVKTIRMTLAKVAPIQGHPNALILHDTRPAIAQVLKKYKHLKHPKSVHSGLAMTQTWQQLLLGHLYKRVAEVEEECPTPALEYGFNAGVQVT